MKNINKIIVTLLLVLSSSFLSAQNTPQNLQDIEGTWKYQDEEVEFYINLRYKKVEIYEGDILFFLVGYAKLIYQNELIYDYLYRLKNLNKEVLSLKEISGIDNLENHTNLTLRKTSNTVSGTLLIPNYGGFVKVKCEYDNELLTLHFSKPHQEVIRPDIVQKREAMYANYIPELPSTWVLERVTEDEIKE